MIAFSWSILFAIIPDESLALFGIPPAPTSEDSEQRMLHQNNWRARGLAPPERIPGTALQRNNTAYVFLESQRVMSPRLGATDDPKVECHESPTALVLLYSVTLINTLFSIAHSFSESVAHIRDYIGWDTSSLAKKPVRY
ncbi:hypothetical protein TNCV_3644351 [Trichonephila clavipes]|nr:hypothetical protein TNCV_3644351 [Trichonephila clavipes]